MSGAASRLMMLGIKGYRLAISPWFGSACRFTPSCSAYALDAIGTHGAIRGAWLSARRLVRCHPWGGSGYDPVPAGIRRPSCRHDNNCHAPHRG